jgi:membrane protease YdiL (CAAX protease family)
MDEPEIHETTQEKVKPRQWRFTIFHALGLFILFVAMQGFVYLLIKNQTGLDQENWRWYHFCVENGVSGAIAVMVGAYLIGFSVDSLLFDNLPRVPQILAVIFASLGVLILSNELDNFLRHVIPIASDNQLIVKLMSEDFIGIVITSVIVAPIFEELLFRGVIFDGLRFNYNVATGMFVSSFLFGLGHLNVFVSINTFFLALFLAWIRLRSGSLMLCVITHAMFNATQLMAGRILGKQISGFNMPSDTLAYQPKWFDGLGLALFIIGIVGLILTTREDKNFRTSPSGQAE